MILNTAAIHRFHPSLHPCQNQRLTSTHHSDELHNNPNPLEHVTVPTPHVSLRSLGSLDGGVPSSVTLAVPELSKCERLTTNHLVAGSSLAETVLSARVVVVVAGGDKGEREVGEDDTVSEGVPGLERDVV